MANLVRVKDKFQVTLPLALRRQFHVQQGDYLEASIGPDGIVLRPQKTATASVLGTPTLLDFLREPRPYLRSRQQIDAALAADRESWDK
jgi:AbrB family looped-hinge helix DNA binding protein